MRWLFIVLIFLLAYIEISLFIKVADVLGVAITMLLVVLTSCIGVSLVRNQGIKTLIQIRQKITAGEIPAAEMVKTISLMLAGVLLLLPGFLTDFLGLLLLLPPIQNLLTLRLVRHVTVYRSRNSGKTFDGEFRRTDNTRSNAQDKLNQQDDKDSAKDDK